MPVLDDEEDLYSTLPTLNSLLSSIASACCKDIPTRLGTSTIESSFDGFTFSVVLSVLFSVRCSSVACSVFLSSVFLSSFLLSDFFSVVFSVVFVCSDVVFFLSVSSYLGAASILSLPSLIHSDTVDHTFTSVPASTLWDIT